jgi:dTMP kinase
VTGRARTTARGDASGERRGGLFVTFEGIEGSGKSTQARLLLDALIEQGVSAEAVHEPGGTPLGQRIREILLDRAQADMTVAAELLLYEASRAQLVRAVIAPALEAGRTVLCDRYVDSTVAYQAFGRGIPRAMVDAANEVATGGLMPALTFLLDVEARIGLERLGQERDRIESEPLEFHERVRAGFLAVAACDPARFLVLDGTQPADVLARAVAGRVLDSVQPWH